MKGSGHFFVETFFCSKEKKRKGYIIFLKDCKGNDLIYSFLKAKHNGSCVDSFFWGVGLIDVLGGLQAQRAGLRAGGWLRDDGWEAVFLEGNV